MRKYYCSANRRAFYASRMESQGGRCAICRRKDRLVIDHDHSSGLMRGLLCHRHSTGLRLFQDSPAMLREAATYLEQHASEPPRNDVNSTVEELLPKLLEDVSFPSDRARARILAEKAGILVATAQTRIHRARKKARESA